MSRPGWIRQAISGWVYPPVCGACDSPLDSDRQRSRPFLCESCEERLTPISGDYCRICGQSYEIPQVYSRGCANCSDRELAIDFAVSAYRSTGMARDLMHQFKYGKQRHLSRLMGALIQRVFEDERLRSVSRWRVVPVPLHRKRMRDRGFNQAHEIALELVRHSSLGPGRDLELSVDAMLKRTANTVRQASLDRRERLRNAAGVFATRRSIRPLAEGEGVLLVDDVITTGTTVSECAAALRSACDGNDFAAISVLRG